jgi:hypothetical protein
MELRAVIEDYLSAKHLSAPGTGCPLAALSNCDKFGKWR